MRCKKHFYRPQTKLRKGYVFTPVCHSVHGGMSAPVHAGIHTSPVHTPPGQTPPKSRHPLGSRHSPKGDTLREVDTHWEADTPQEADTPWKQTPPEADTPLPREADTPLPCRRLLLRTVRFLLECILVYFVLQLIF